MGECLGTAWNSAGPDDVSRSRCVARSVDGSAEQGPRSQRGGCSWAASSRRPVRLLRVHRRHDPAAAQPVDVDAVLFWKVLDPKKAALDVADYQTAISWASQTALRDVIGKTMLSDMLEGRDKISEELQKIIDERTEPWGINVISVEVKDVLIPPALEDAMSMQAQAERERQARVILGDSERQVAEKFGEAAKTYSNNPTALHLRAMNMLYEGLKHNATIVIVPSTVAETMQLGTVAGLTALTKEQAGRTGPWSPSGASKP